MVEKLARSLRVFEIFYSLQGESTSVGMPTIFVRLAGCPLRCQYCDTAYAFHGGEFLDINEIMQRLQQWSCRRICLTGGEPLAQRGSLQLMQSMCDAGYTVSIETSGALSIESIDPRVRVVMDIKTPASGESDKNLWKNLDYLKPNDELKFVLCNHSDYLWAKSIISANDLSSRCSVLLSVSHQQLSPSDLADWILEDALPVRFQLQLHKVLWGDLAGK